MDHSKRYNNNVEKVDRQKEYGIEEAADILLSFNKTKFDEYVNIDLNPLEETLNNQPEFD